MALVIALQEQYVIWIPVFTPRRIMFEIVAQQEDFLLINKPANIPMFSTDHDKGIMAIVKEHFQEPLYPVHRLDQVTSGLLLFAKNKETNRALSMQFEQRLICKFYLALSSRKPKKKQGCIKGDMLPARRGCWRLSPTHNNPAITQFFSAASGECKRLFVLKPRTGKTHQIRVALKSLGAPILGDTRYGCQEPSDRVYLHAYGLGFELGGEPFYYQVAPLEGEYFKDLPEALLDPRSLPWPTI